jgi:hypothetical protein
MEKLKQLWWRLKATDEENALDVLDRMLSVQVKAQINLELQPFLEAIEEEAKQEVKDTIHKLAEDLPDGDELKNAIGEIGKDGGH